MLITKVKVNRVTNLSDARYCAGMGVDFLSFPVTTVDPKTYQEITGWVAGPQFGIEIEASDIDKIHLYRCDFIQVGVNQIEQLTEATPAVITLDISSWKSQKSKLHSIKNQIITLEFELAQLTESEIDAIKEAAKDFEVFIQYNGSLDLHTLLQLPLTGISLEGNSETKPGLKEYPFAEILERLEVVD